VTAHPAGTATFSARIAQRQPVTHARLTATDDRLPCGVRCAVRHDTPASVRAGLLGHVHDQGSVGCAALIPILCGSRVRHRRIRNSHQHGSSQGKGCKACCRSREALLASALSRVCCSGFRRGVCLPARTLPPSALSFSGTYPPGLVGQYDEPDPGDEAELVQKVRDMGLHRRLSDFEPRATSSLLQPRATAMRPRVPVSSTCGDLGPSGMAGRSER
jgi:hypothetical protein